MKQTDLTLWKPYIKKFPSTFKLPINNRFLTNLTRFLLGNNNRRKLSECLFLYTQVYIMYI